MAVLFCFGLGACDAPSKPVQSTAPITLEFWTLQLDTFKTTLEPMFQAYEKAHPTVHIHWVDIPFSEGPKRALTALMSNVAPDVINLNPDFSAILANRNALMNLNTLLPQPVRDSYLPIAWQAATLSKETKTASDFAFGVPWYVTSSVTLYNRNLLKQAHLIAPPQTFDQLDSFARTVRRQTGAYGLMPTMTENGNFLKELRKLGLPLYDVHGRAIFASDAAVAHLARYAALYQAGLLPAEALTESHQAAVGRYQAGTLAMIAIGPNFLKIIQQNAPGIYKVTGVAPQFPANATYQDFSLMVLVVPRKSAHSKEAADFAAFMTNAANQLALAKAAPVLPSVTSALQDPYFKATPQDDLLSQGRAISARQLLNARESYQIRPDQNAINQIVDYYVQSALLGKLKPRNALQKAEADCNATLGKS